MERLVCQTAVLYPGEPDPITKGVVQKVDLSHLMENVMLTTTSSFVSDLQKFGTIVVERMATSLNIKAKSIFAEFVYSRLIIRHCSWNRNDLCGQVCRSKQTIRAENVYNS